MKTLPLLIAFLLIISLTACAGTPLPPTNHQVEKNPEAILVRTK